MTTTLTARIAGALGRLRTATARRADLGRLTSRSVSTLTDGLRSETRDGPVVIHADLPPGLGGGATAPSPTALARAALGSCLAMRYRMHASELGIELTTVRVTVESDADVRGMLDVGATAPPGFAAVRYHVEIDGPAPEHELRRVVELSDQLSPVLDLFSRPHVVERTVSIGTGR